MPLLMKPDVWPHDHLLLLLAIFKYVHNGGHHHGVLVPPSVVMVSAIELLFVKTIKDKK
jgi:hypothetical protein